MIPTAWVTPGWLRRSVLVKRLLSSCSAQHPRTHSLDKYKRSPAATLMFGQPRHPAMASSPLGLGVLRLRCSLLRSTPVERCLLPGDIITFCPTTCPLLSHAPCEHKSLSRLAALIVILLLDESALRCPSAYTSLADNSAQIVIDLPITSLLCAMHADMVAVKGCSPPCQPGRQCRRQLQGVPCHCTRSERRWSLLQYPQQWSQQ